MEGTTSAAKTRGAHRVKFWRGRAHPTRRRTTTNKVKLDDTQSYHPLVEHSIEHRICDARNSTVFTILSVISRIHRRPNASGKLRMRRDRETRRGGVGRAPTSRETLRGRRTEEHDAMGSSDDMPCMMVQRNKNRAKLDIGQNTTQYPARRTVAQAQGARRSDHGRCCGGTWLGTPLRTGERRCTGSNS